MFFLCPGATSSPGRGLAAFGESADNQKDTQTNKHNKTITSDHVTPP